MKINLISFSILSALLLLVAGCSSDDDSTARQAAVSKRTVSVSQLGFTSADPVSRVSYSAASTSFTNNDAIGIYVVNSSGTLVDGMTNMKLTYNGTNWVDDSGNTYLNYIVAGKYFAYYPYSADMTAASVTVSGATAADFFAPAITARKANIATDQSTLAKFTSYDLMVAMASEAGGQITSTAFTFTFAHTMAMIEFQLAQVSTSSVLKYTFTSHSLYNISNGTYRMIVAPETAITVNGDLYDGTYKSGTFTMTDAGLTAGYYKIFRDGNTEASLTTK